MLEIYQDEIEDRAIKFRGLSTDSLINQLSTLKMSCDAQGFRLENSKKHALDVLAVLNELARNTTIIEFPPEIVEWMTEYIRKRNKERPETPKIVSIW